MQLPVGISYRGVEKSDPLDQLIRGRAERLDRFCDHISRCDVVVEHPNHAQRSGNPFRVRIDVNDAFKTMERLLKTLVEKQRRG